jgi:outer membrane immunogenic protein
MRILACAAGALALAASVSSAAAADLRPRMPAKAPVMAAEVWNWNGFYLGLNGGYSWGRSRSDVSFFTVPGGVAIAPPAGSVTSSSFNLDGGVFGGQAGWNWQSGAFLFGLETDLQWSGEKGSTAFLCASAVGILPACLPGFTFLAPGGPAGTTVTVSQSIEWFGTFRGRAGMLFTPSVLGYVTGGLAYGGVKTDLAIGGFSPVLFPLTAASAVSSNRTTRLGWTVGAGIEAMFARDWSAKIEYLYMDLGSYTNSVALAFTPAFGIGATVNSRVTDNIIRGGINYHFSPGPVVARY